MDPKTVIFVLALNLASVGGLLYMIGERMPDPAGMRGFATGSVVFGLAYQKLSGVVSWIKTTTSLLKVGLSVILVSAFGLKGAAYSALICVLIQVIWTIRRSQAVYRIEIEWRNLLTRASQVVPFEDISALRVRNEYDDDGYAQPVPELVLRSRPAVRLPEGTLEELRHGVPSLPRDEMSGRGRDVLER